MYLFGNCARIVQVISTQQTAKSIKISTYKDLIAWQKANLLAEAIYAVSNSFPKSETFGITSQLRRAALSVPTNIVEGFGRLNKNEFRHFLSIAFGSLAEVGYLLEFSHKQGYISDKELIEIVSIREECSRLIWGLHKSQKSV